MCQLNRFLVKGMVCQRCISIVQKLLLQGNVPVASVTLGEVILQNPIDDESIESLRKALAAYGFELMDDRQSRLVREVKALIEDMFGDDPDLADIKFASYISGKLYKDYDTISSHFSSCQGISLEKYYLGRRIEKVKEFLVNSEMSINNIAFNLGYSSVAHLSKQFKDITGMNLSGFREIKNRKNELAIGVR
ncbi:MAG TPA: helix-turn-helix domain-containing protein [Chitinophagaceae bacterium]